MRALVAVLLLGCGSPPPVEAPKEEPVGKTAKSEKTEAATIEYDLGPVDPNIFKKRVESLRATWNDCYSSAHEKHEVLEGKLTFTVRTVKDGSVKWAFIKEANIGSRAIEKCVIDSIKSTNFGPPTDAKEGEVQGHTIGWELDGDARAADPGAEGAVLPSIEKAKSKIDACRKGSAGKAKMTATIYVAKGGKPLSVGLAISDASADESIDCVVSLLMGLKYVNKASWPTKVTVQLP